MYDFSGYATKNDLKCSDGLIIRKNAFKDSDHTRVPLVWQHYHDSPSNVLGHADLENKENGVYAYCTFNDTEAGQNAKALVRHGDITSMSIYANRLIKQGSNVVHGLIREVSLVMAGANPGAVIDPLSVAHSDGSLTEIDDEAIIYTGEDFIMHSDKQEGDDKMANDSDKKETESDTNEETIGDILKTFNKKQMDVLEYLVSQAMEKGQSSVKHADDSDGTNSDDSDDDSNDDETIEDVLKTFSKKQRMVLEFLVGQALAKNNKSDDVEEDMKHNAFDDQSTTGDEFHELSHSEISEYIAAAKRGSNGSLKEEFLSHGIENLEVLYPEAKMVGQNPELISRDMGWVTKVWNSLRKTPFARTRSVAANITEYEARARGYVKGNQKIEEVLSLLGRSTTPQTVYKLQKIDRDDVVDITDLDIVAWMKNEMRTMLNEEIVRAVLVGDDRPATDQSYINPEHIRPIYQDSDVYTIHDVVEIESGATFNDIADAIIEHSVLARKNYMGSGTPIMLASTDVITRMLLAKDTLGHRMYRNESELAAALRVSEIVEVPIFDGVTRTAQVTSTSGSQTVTTSEERKLLALIVNLNDYTVGTDKGGEVNLFDNFDLNFNKYEYLIETRCSGALTKPYSAIAIETTSELPFSFGTVSGMYKNRKDKGETGITG